MKHLFVFVIILLTSTMISAQYNGVKDRNYRGAILYSQPNFEGTQQVLTQIGQSANFEPRSVRVYGGYKVRFTLGGNTSAYFEKDRTSISNSTNTSYSLEAGTFPFAAILYSGPNQDGTAWFVENNMNLNQSTPGWSTRFGKSGPRSMKLGLNRATCNLVGQNGNRSYCGGIHKENGGYRSVSISSANKCRPNGVRFHNGKYFRGTQNTTLAVGTYGQADVPDRINSIEVPPGYVVKVLHASRLQPDGCFQSTANVRVAPSGLNTALRRIREVAICNTQDLTNCSCNSN